MAYKVAEALHAAGGAIVFPRQAIEARCVICGETFAYPAPAQGRRRVTCSPECKRERHKRQLRKYAAARRGGDLFDEGDSDE